MMPRDKVFYVAATAMAVLLAFTYLGTRRQNALAQELLPYVERVDGQPGLSRVDMLDFARRAELPGWAVAEIKRSENFYQAGLTGNGFYPRRNMKRALQSYRGGK